MSQVPDSAAFFRIQGSLLNRIVLGDQVVMSPVFIGSEPVKAESGKYQGTVVMQEEQDLGLAFMQSLSKEQQAKALIQGEKGPTNALAEAFKDNLVVDYAGIRASGFDDSTKKRFLELIASGGSDVDVRPLQHVADAMLLGRRHLIDPFVP